jgi:hypothetical protein
MDSDETRSGHRRSGSWDGSRARAGGARLPRARPAARQSRGWLDLERVPGDLRDAEFWSVRWRAAAWCFTWRPITAWARDPRRSTAPTWMARATLQAAKNRGVGASYTSTVGCIGFPRAESGRHARRLKHGRRLQALSFSPNGWRSQVCAGFPMVLIHGAISDHDVKPAHREDRGGFPQTATPAYIDTGPTWWMRTRPRSRTGVRARTQREPTSGAENLTLAEILQK